MNREHPAKQTWVVSEPRLYNLLGCLDSNQEQLNQNQPCCQLHHTPPLGSFLPSGPPIL